MKKIALGAILIMVLALQAHSAPIPDSANQPSFSCAAPSVIEAAICSDPSLAARDRTMAMLYAAARSGAVGSGSSQEVKQRKWLKSRNARCSKEDMRPCLADVYDDRLSTLAVASLMLAPDAALAELSRQDSKTAPIYKAIYKYATINDPVERSKAVESLIASVFSAIHEEPWASPLHDVSNARAATSSDHNFAMFLDVVSVSDYSLTLPCAAIVRRPGLIDALDALYGGAIDGQLLSSDCESTLPLLPKLDQLVSTAETDKGSCGGTVRFSSGREYEKTLVAIRLHRTDLWHANVKSKRGERFRAKHQAQIDAAIAELAKYYSNVFAVSQKDNQVDAERAVEVAYAGGCI